MMNSLSVIGFSILLVLLVNALVLINARRERRLAEARLSLAKIATTLEQLMLDGKFAHGETCHDHLYQIIFRAQLYPPNISPSSLLRLPRKQEVAFIQSIEKEMEQKDASTKELIAEFFSARRREFHFRQPIMYCGFVAWVWLFTGSIIALWHTVRAMISLLLLVGKGINIWTEIVSRFNAKAQNFTNRIGEWAIARSSSNLVPVAVEVEGFEPSARLGV